MVVCLCAWIFKHIISEGAEYPYQGLIMHGLHYHTDDCKHHIGDGTIHFVFIIYHITVTILKASYIINDKKNCA